MLDMFYCRASSNFSGTLSVRIFKYLNGSSYENSNSLYGGSLLPYLMPCTILQVKFRNSQEDTFIAISYINRQLMVSYNV